LGPVVAGHIFDIARSYQPFFLILVGVGIAALSLTLFLQRTIRKA
jgi:cyanate permease